MTDDTNEIKLALLRIREKLPADSRFFWLHPNLKKPPPAGWQSFATNDPEAISYWLDSDPRRNVAIIVGDDVAIIDVEGPHKNLEKGQSGDTSFAQLETLLGPLPDLGHWTASALHGRGYASRWSKPEQLGRG